MILWVHNRLYSLYFYYYVTGNLFYSYILYHNLLRIPLYIICLLSGSLYSYYPAFPPHLQITRNFNGEACRVTNISWSNHGDWHAIRQKFNVWRQPCDVLATRLVSPLGPAAVFISTDGSRSNAGGAFSERRFEGGKKGECWTLFFSVSFGSITRFGFGAWSQVKKNQRVLRKIIELFPVYITLNEIHNSNV